MTAKVIQGFFLRSRPKLPPVVAQPKAMPRPPGPPAPAFGGRSAVAQPRSSDNSFQVDPGQLSLVSGGGRPLPEAVRGKMEAALGADFANVRVHVGPQAERIGAVAFTLVTDIYFAPGRFQPNTVQGQQLLGHELAHVVQQRQGRARNPIGVGVTVVQNTALEVEADRMGILAAARPQPIKGQIQCRSDPRDYKTSQVRVIQQWKSQFTGDEELLDDTYLAILVNQNESFHGHTILVISGNENGTNWYQTVSFVPQDGTVSTKTNEWRTYSVYGKTKGRRDSGGFVRGRLDQITGYADSSPKIGERVAANKTIIKINQLQLDKLQGLIEKYKNLAVNDAPEYAVIGQNCHVFAVKLLIEAGIRVPFIPRIGFVPKSAENHCSIQ